MHVFEFRACVAPRALAVLALLAVLPGAADAQRVRQVIDGDTITVSGVGVVRLIGVDAPEKMGGYRQSEPFGDAATAFMKRLLEGQIVTLEYDGPRKDQYNRTLAYVVLRRRPTGQSGDHPRWPRRDLPSLRLPPQAGVFRRRT